jgi:hypothetical protein
VNSVVHPDNDTIAGAQALTLAAAGRYEEARAYVARRFPDPNSARRIELLKNIERAEESPRPRLRDEAPPTVDS